MKLFGLDFVQELRAYMRMSLSGSAIRVYIQIFTTKGIISQHVAIFYITNIVRND